MGAPNTSQQAYNEFMASAYYPNGVGMPTYEQWVQQQNSTSDMANYNQPNPYGVNGTIGGGAPNISQNAYRQFTASAMPGPGQSLPTYQQWVQQQQQNAITDPRIQATGTSMVQPNTNAAGSSDPINGLYQSILGRAPDAAGLKFWQEKLASGVPINDIANAFKSSPEAATNRASNPYGITTGNQFANSTNPYIQAAQQTSLGNLAGARTATAANRVNQSTPYSNLQYTQTGTDANGNPIWSANQTLAGPLAGAQSSLAQSVANQAARGFNPNTPSVGINPGETYSDAIMRRLQPQQQQSAERLDAQLANQGIMPGSEAYNRAKTQLAQQQNDQLTSAQVGGIGVGLQANNQSFNQQLQQANLPITQLGAFQQATQPGYVNPYTQAATSGPDYTGAYATSQAAQIAAQNAANAKTANMQSGLYQLGAAGILGGGGLSGLANLGGSGLTGLANLFGNNGLNNPFVSSTDYMNNIGATNSVFDSNYVSPFANETWF